MRATHTNKREAIYIRKLSFTSCVTITANKSQYGSSCRGRGSSYHRLCIWSANDQSIQPCLSRLTKQGIGRQIAVTFAQRECKKIFLVDISRQGLETTAKLVGLVDGSIRVATHVADLTDDAAVKNMVDTCIQEFGRIDFACNNAGIAMPNLLTVDIPMKTFDKVFDVNLKTVSGPSANFLVVS